MCYEQRLFRSWATQRAQKRKKNQPSTERDRSRVIPIRAAPTSETEPRKEMEREVEEVV
jgi:hypothetical protein